MDPNETLKNIRKLVQENPGYADIETNRDTLAEAFAALDEWIVQGGFLPDAWRVRTSYEAP